MIVTHILSKFSVIGKVLRGCRCRVVWFSEGNKVMMFGLGWGGVPFEPGRSKVFLLKAFVSAVDKDVLHFVVNSSLAVHIVTHGYRVE